MALPKSRLSRVSWADQWESNRAEPVPVEHHYNDYENDARANSSAAAAATTTTSSSSSKYGKKFNEGFVKTRTVTRAMASTGLKKVKEGSFIGFNSWLSNKCHKNTQKQ